MMKYELLLSPNRVWVRSAKHTDDPMDNVYPQMTVLYHFHTRRLAIKSLDSRLAAYRSRYKLEADWRAM